MDQITVTSSTGKEAYKTVIKTSDHELIADEPIDLGGKNSGPTPTDFLAASLASCTSITLRMYANRKEWEIEDIQVTVVLNNEDKANPTLDRTIALIGDLDESQQKRMLTIANACPLHKLLERGIKINTTLK